jgi:hypothetical protein
MAATGNHIVNKVIYHVHGVPVSKAFSIKEDAAAYIKGGFSNKMQTIFNKYFDGDEKIYIDKLQLDINLLPGDIDLIKYEKQLLELLEKQLQKKVKTFQPEKNITKDEYDKQKTGGRVENIVSKNYSPADAFVFFLKKGYLPWWFKMHSTLEFEHEVIAFFAKLSKDKIREIASSILMAGTETVYRFIHQFSDDFKFQFAALFLQKQYQRNLHILLMHKQKKMLPMCKTPPASQLKLQQLFYFGKYAGLY